jgi:alanine racemase
MSKKSRKIKTKGKVIQSVANASTAGLPASAVSKRGAPVAAAIAFQAKNYDYVKSDLVRIGISLYGHWPSRETLVSSRARRVTHLTPRTRVGQVWTPFQVKSTSPVS